jgi:hypothetical protein
MPPTRFLGLKDLLDFDLFAWKKIILLILQSCESRFKQEVNRDF